MTSPRVSVVPPDAEALLFDQADINIVQVGDDFVPDYDPGVLDRALVQLQTAMGEMLERPVSELRSWLDYPSKFRREVLNVSLRDGVPSDVSIAALILHPESPFGIQYEWIPGIHPKWPDGITLVLWRGHLWERHGDLLSLWGA